MSNPPAEDRRIVLASTSPYRRDLLTRLGLSFVAVAPGMDEQRLPGESAVDLTQRLAQAKAQAVADRYPDALIIGSDQVATLDEHILGKPGNHANARRQLQQASGRRVVFLTGLCLLDAASGHSQIDCIPFAVQFRPLDDAAIERYLQREQPYDCAGSFKSEGLGIALFSAMHGEDPTALIGLPLIALVGMLAAAGVAVP